MKKGRRDASSFFWYIMGETSRELQWLFHTWKKFHKDCGCDPGKFVADGIVGKDDAGYLGSKPRVLFLLKDANDTKNILSRCGFDICNLWRNPEKFTSHKKTVERVCGMWAYGIHNRGYFANANEAR